MQSYLKLSVAALLPVAATLIFVLIDIKTGFGKDGSLKAGRKIAGVRQLIIGIVFGGLAIVGTEWGIPINGAMVNARDAAVLTAGLLFGGPAGVVAGIIGGAERWVAVAWGVGSFTRVACSVSTIIAGFYAALLRRYMLDNKRPTAILSLAIGVVMEVFHLTMVFITNLSDTTRAAQVVKACTGPMVIANSVSVMLATLLVTLIVGRQQAERPRRPEISETIQRRLLLCVAVAFVLTTGFNYILQTRIAENDTGKAMEVSIADLAADVSDASDNNLLRLSRLVAADLEKTLDGQQITRELENRQDFTAEDLSALAEKYGVSEINLVGADGIICASSSARYPGFDMMSGKQSAEFMILLGLGPDGKSQTPQRELVQEYGPIAADSNLYMKYAGVAIEKGFVQVGYDADHFQKEIDSQIVAAANHRHTNDSGVLFVVDGNGIIVSGPAGYLGRYIGGTPLSDSILANKSGQLFETPVYGEDSLCMYSVTEGYTIIATMLKSDAMNVRNMATYVNTFTQIMVFGFLFLMVYLLIKGRVVNKIHTVNGELKSITDGNLETKVDVRSNLEFSSLSDGINSTVDALKGYIDQAEERIAVEMRMAAGIQTSALPSVFPAFPQRSEMDIFALMDPAKEVGGDFYDFYLTHRDILNFLVADVSGKGIPAALFMMRAKTMLKSLTESDISVSEAFTRGNDGLCEGNEAGMFVTAWQGQIDLTTGLVQFANAGHNPPLVKHKEGGFEYLKARSGLVLAGLPGIPYKLQTLQLEPGDIIFLYTDGVTEATSAETELYGEERLQKALNTAVSSPVFTDMESLCRMVKADVEAFVGDAPQFDDITMLAFRYMPGADNIVRKELCVTADPANVTPVTNFVEGALEENEVPFKVITQMNIAIDEIFSNIAIYGYGADRISTVSETSKQARFIPDGEVLIRLEISKDPGLVKLSFMDGGIPFDPLQKADPDVHAALEDRPEGGLGIFMVKKIMDSVDYEYLDNKNILTLTKRF